MPAAFSAGPSLTAPGVTRFELGPPDHFIRLRRTATNPLNFTRSGWARLTMPAAVFARPVASPAPGVRQLEMVRRTISNSRLRRTATNPLSYTRPVSAILPPCRRRFIARPAHFKAEPHDRPTGPVLPALGRTAPDLLNSPALAGTSLPCWRRTAFRRVLFSTAFCVFFQILPNGARPRINRFVHHSGQSQVERAGAQWHWALSLMRPSCANRRNGWGGEHAHRSICLDI